MDEKYFLNASVVLESLEKFCRYIPSININTLYTHNKYTITMKILEENQKRIECTWQEEETHHPSVSSLRSSNYKGRASFLPIRRRKCRRSEWKSRCFNVHSLFFPLASPFGGWKQIILLELPPSSWSVIGLVPRHGHNSLSLFLCSTVIVDPSFPFQLTSGTNHN